MPIDPRIPSSAGDPSGIAARLADLDRRVRLLSTQSGQLGRQSGVGVVVVTWAGATSFSSFGTVSGLGAVTGITASAELASNAKLIVVRVVPGSDIVIGYTADGSVPANGTTCIIYYNWWI